MTVGSLRNHYSLGDFVILSGFGTSALSSYAPKITTYNEPITPHLDPEFQNLVKMTINSLGARHHDSGVYVQNNILGRYETDVEIHEFAKIGHIIGKFGCDEISYLCRDNVKVGALAVIINISHSHTSETPAYTKAELKHSLKNNTQRVEHAIENLILELSRKPLQRKQVDLILHGRYVLPMTPDCPILENHSVVINDKKIVEVIDSSKVYEKYIPRTAKYYSHNVLLPGFINCHTHLPMNIFKGYGDDMPLCDWLNNKIWPAEGKFIDPEFLADGMRMGIAELIKSGITCFNDMYFGIPTEVSVGKEIGIRGVYGFSVMSFATKDAKDCDDALKKAEQYINDNRKDCDLVYFSIAPHAPYTVNPPDFAKCVNLAKKLKVPIHTHIQETDKEVEDYKKEHNCSPIEKLNEMGLLGPHFISVHSVSLSDKDIEILGKTKCSVVHNPSSNLKLASGITRISDLQKVNVNIALGTDSAASNNSLSMFNEMRAAALIGKVKTLDAVSVPAKDVLFMATINGAKALGLENEIGSLESGKYADVTVLDVDRVEMIPLFDIVSQIVYCGQRDIVSDVFVGGKQLLRNGLFTTINPYELFGLSDKWVKKLRDFEESNSKSSK